MRHFKIKNIFSYVVVAALVMALFISCKSNEAPQETGSTTQNHPPAGSYISSLIGNPYASPSMTNGKATVVNNLDGTCHITGTAYYDDTTYQNFDITITKWWYQFDYPDSYYASSYDKSEATLNSPTTDYFSVSYYRGNGELRISFGPSGSRYDTYTLVKKQ